MHDLDYRITDLSGEQYYFKEAALALGRIGMRSARTNSTSGTRPNASANPVPQPVSRWSRLRDAASRKGYAPGPERFSRIRANDTANVPPQSGTDRRRR